ncbi:esterase E4 [Lasioglossum baleicum]|uniref:esterase E4 n=1 Tax=Lasioglossum baleicum TaxID=434251 RepID=UPI003FCDB062
MPAVRARPVEESRVDPDAAQVVDVIQLAAVLSVSEEVSVQSDFRRGCFEMDQGSRFGGSADWRRTLVLIIVFMVVAGHSTIVQTKFGPIRGFWSRSTKGRLTACYLGVPYAEPPIGDLRFRSPQSWTGTWNVTYDAVADGNKCLQSAHHGQIVGSEDCLYLNIFLPVLSEKQERTEKLPVLVFVHGGKYMFGSGDSQTWSPEHMMDQNVVLVTINYRLNIMGFFSTESKLAPGNYGLKDIVMALRWVQENIEVFHGDPNSVTLWGHSAGAAATHTLAFSKNTEGLFHRYILMSSAIFATWNVNPKDWMRRTSLEIAEVLGCLPQGTENSTVGEKCPTDFEDQFCERYGPTMDMHLSELDEEMLRCMRSLDAKTIGGALDHFDIWKGSPCCPFGPVIEEESEEAVLTADPLITIKNREFRDLPCIFGVVRDEGLVITLDIKDSLDELKDNFKEYILLLTEQHRQVSGRDEFVKAVEEFYFSSNVSGLSFDDLTQATSDALMIWPVYQVAKHQSPVMKSNHFFYFFTYEGTLSNKFSYGTPIHRGISHGDELKYLMPSSNKNKMLKRTEADVTMTNIMTAMWASFAATGVPEASGTIPWPDYKHSHEYLLLGNGEQPEVTVEDSFLPARMAFWIKVTNDTVEIEDEEAEPEALLSPEDTPGCSSAQDYNHLLIFLPILLIALF